MFNFYVQSSTVEDCGLQKDDNNPLPFDFEGGSCNAYPNPDDASEEIIYFCFGDKENKVCRT